MKFSSSLKFNAVSEWWDEYIAYDALKKYIYQLEKQSTGGGAADLTTSFHTLIDADVEAGANENTFLLPSSATRGSDAVFVPILNRELQKITFFYESQEKEIFAELAELEELVKKQEEAGLYADNYYDDDDGIIDEEDEEDEELVYPGGILAPVSQPGTRRRRKSSSVATAHRRSQTTGTAGAESSLSPVRTRQYSISSNESAAEDMSASLIASTGGRSPMSTMRSIANRFNFMSNSATLPENIWTAKTNYAYDTRLLFKRRITNLYVSFSALRSYVEINYSGFRKILKKYDKVTYSELKDNYLHTAVSQALPFLPSSKEQLNTGINTLVDLYAKCVTRSNATIAKQQLKLYQRENIAWERDTIWRQMIGAERRGELSASGMAGDVVDGGLAGMPGESMGRALGGTLIVGDEAPTLVKLGRFKLTKKKIYAVLALAVFITFLNISVIPESEEANKCLAILFFCTVLWATEAIPLFVTSLMVPLLLVCFRVIRDDSDEHTVLSAKDATKYVFSTMFSPTIMLLIGGFTISSALSKTNIDKVIITKVLSFAGRKPSTVLLAFMGVSCFASMWISNVAAPMLCFTLIRPILRTLPPKSSFAPCLILAIALAANIGGQSSPISSPQNLIALQAMEPPLDWAKWFAVAIPVSAISIVLIWLLLLVTYKPARSPDGEGDIEIRTIRPTKESFSIKQWWVIGVCVLTIALWCVEHGIEDEVGDMGVIAIIPIVLFFGTGVLKKDDFEQFAWSIVFLAMGGIALGKGVVSSGLLDVLDSGIRQSVTGLSLYTVVLVLSPIVLIISTFISHTIAAVLLVPIAKEVGKNLGDHQNLLIFITGLICSTGMGMPVSGFPNQTAATQEDDLGQLYLSNIDFLQNGVPASIIATMVVSTVGFILMKAVGL